MQIGVATKPWLFAAFFLGHSFTTTHVVIRNYCIYAFIWQPWNFRIPSWTNQDDSWFMSQVSPLGAIHVDDRWWRCQIHDASDSEDEFTRRANRMVSRPLGDCSRIAGHCPPYFCGEWQQQLLWHVITDAFFIIGYGSWIYGLVV